MTGMGPSISTEALMQRVARSYLLHLAVKKPAPLPSIFGVDPTDEKALKDDLLSVFDQVEGKPPKPKPKAQKEQDDLWEQFLQAKYGKLGGNTLIKNTNPNTSSKYPKVQVDTLIQGDQLFAKKLRAEFELWKGKKEEAEGFQGGLESAIDEVQAPTKKKKKEPKVDPKLDPSPIQGKSIHKLTDLKQHDVIQFEGPSGPALARVVKDPFDDSISFVGINSETGEDKDTVFEKSKDEFLSMDPSRAKWSALPGGVKSKIKQLKKSKPSEISEPSKPSKTESIKLNDEDAAMLKEWGDGGSGMYELGKRHDKGEEITKDLLEEADKEIQGLLSADLHSPAFEAELKKIDGAIKAALSKAPSSPKPKKPKPSKKHPSIGIGDKVDHPSQVKEGDWVSLKDAKGTTVVGQIKAVHSTSFEMKDYHPDGSPWSDFEGDLAEVKLKHLSEKADAQLIDTPGWAQPKKQKLQGKKLKKLKQLKQFDALTWEGEGGERQRGYVVQSGSKKIQVQPVSKTGKPEGDAVTITQSVMDGSDIRRLPSSQTPGKLKKFIDQQKQKLKGKGTGKPFKDLKPGDTIWEKNQIDPFIVESVDEGGEVTMVGNDTPYVVDDLEKGSDGGVLHVPAGGHKDDKPADEKIKWVSLDPIGSTSDKGWEVFHPAEAMGGATPGVFYQGPDGQKYYVKIPPSEDHVRNEILSAKLYEAAGIKVPELQVVDHNGQMALASSYIPGLTYSAKKLQAGGVPQVAEGFGTDAWLANWDVVGKGSDANNMPIDPEGDAVRVDMGGAIMYHGVGEPKQWSSFPEHVAEIDTFKDPNWSKSKIYKHISDSEIADSIQRVVDIPEDTVEKLVKKYGPTSPMKQKKLLDRLLARQKNLAEQQKKYQQQAGKQAFLKQAAMWRAANTERPAIPETFFMFLKDEFGPDGGREKVRNTNPESKGKYEEVEVFTLMRSDDNFRKKVIRAYRLWEARRKESEQHFETREPHVDVDQDDWEQTGSRGGSNPGGFYTGPEGDEWYVKTPQTPDHVNNEILASEIYQLGGVSVPDTKPAKRNGQYSVASKIIPDLREDEKKLTADELPEGVSEGMAMDAWLGNWDVVGLTYDNMLLDDDDKAHRVDVGGALRYRAMGSPKGDKFGHEVTELGRMLNPQKKSGSVFSNMTDEQVVDSIQRVLDVDMDKVRDLIGEHGPPDQADKTDLFTTLQARRKHLEELQREFKEGHGSKHRTKKEPPKPSRPWSGESSWMDQLNWGWGSSDDE